MISRAQEDRVVVAPVFKTRLTVKGVRLRTDIAFLWYNVVGALVVVSAALVINALFTEENKEKGKGERAGIVS